MKKKKKEPKPPLWLRWAWRSIAKRFQKITPITDDMSELPHQGEYGIKDSVEAAVGVKLFLGALNAALADGKLGFNDVGYFISAQQGIINAVEGANNIRKEAGDLQREEAIVLAGYLYDLIDEVVKLVKKSDEPGLPD